MAKVELRGVHVRYPVFTSGSQESLFSNVVKRASFGVLGKSMSSTEVHALRGISFTLREGDRLGVIGMNGSGKTTLLKTLAGITWPQEGLLQVEGKVSSIISLGAGLNGERTGYENIDFHGRLFGLDAATRDAVAKDVADFTELGEFLNLPTRTYSSGMTLRLSYAIATALPGEILVVDEILGAGDVRFQERAAARSKERYGDAKIFVMATHSPGALVEYCNYAIWLDRGQIVDHGRPEELWARYAMGTPRGAEQDPFRKSNPDPSAGETPESDSQQAGRRTASETGPRPPDS